MRWARMRPISVSAQQHRLQETEPGCIQILFMFVEFELSVIRLHPEFHTNVAHYNVVIRGDANQTKPSWQQRKEVASLHSHPGSIRGPSYANGPPVKAYISSHELGNKDSSLWLVLLQGFH